jgi:hypothetical protein
MSAHWRVVKILGENLPVPRSPCAMSSAVEALYNERYGVYYFNRKVDKGVA